MERRRHRRRRHTPWYRPSVRTGEPSPLPKPTGALSEERFEVVQDASERFIHARYETETWRSGSGGRSSSSDAGEAVGR
jgi:hypothetical protein